MSPAATITQPPADPRYQADDPVLLTGVQALVRAVLEQQRRDHAAGHDSAAFVSGYEGSPLGGLDIELGRQRALLDREQVVHQPGLNEELAATAVGGTQLASQRPDARFDGVVGWWYGKSPGLDRATDALRHANMIGTHAGSGAVALVGDDPAAKSSTIPGASEMALADLGMPTLFPADPHEVLQFALHAVAMSRESGLWTALKVVTNVADGVGSVRPAALVTPRTSADAEPHTPVANLLGPVPLRLEASAQGERLERARAYARRNRLDVIDSQGPRDRIGIVAAGKTYLDVRLALEHLGLDDERRGAVGIRLLKLGMVVPLEPEALRDFAEGLDEILVVEDKRPYLETAVKDALYDLARRPTVTGKRDPDGLALLPADGELDAERVARALGRRVLAHEDVPGVAAWLTANDRPAPKTVTLPTAARTPYFCSGCPHNSSTKTPAGTVVGAGIGCHGLVLTMDPEQFGDSIGLAQMGGEGLQWVGMAPFVGTSHLVQNLGDGTFHHSGSLAVRAAVAAKANITFRLLYNSAVAMTGGQEAVGLRTVPELTELLRAEGVARTIVTTEDPARYRGADLARGVEVWHRDRLEEAHAELAGVPGVTVIVHDQECATEKRRRLKRTPDAPPQQRPYINERVCEGCGDCGVVSNCLSVEPVDTDYGRKTRIHQASCNTDLSCLKGDCPSFLTVVPASGKRRVTPSAAPPMPEPEPVVDVENFNVRLAGIGGTGIVTVAQLIAQAAQLSGLHVRALDQTGLSQKAGPVISDIRVSSTPSERAHRLGTGEADAYLVCDMLVGSDPKHLSAAAKDRTIAVISESKVPTGRMVSHSSIAFPATDGIVARILRASRPALGARLDARALCIEELGNDQCANVVVVGAAYQAGALPLPLESLEEAIRRGGVAVEQNLRALALGREAVLGRRPAVAPRAVRQSGEDASAALVAAPAGSELERLVVDRTAELASYQSSRYARRYAEVVERVRAAEVACAPDAELALSRAVARNLYKLMAYKDEYEVARLHLDPDLAAQVEAEFGPGAKVAFRLHPPVLRALGMKRKIAIPAPVGRALFRILRAGRRLRGTPVDPFGQAKVRRVERRLAREFRELAIELASSLTAENHALAVQLAVLPDLVRGYEDIKLANVAMYDVRKDELLAALRSRS